MRLDDLRRELAGARDEQTTADSLVGRKGVERFVRRARVQRTGLAVVLVLAVVSAAVFLATRGTDEQRVISGPEFPAHYLPDPVPEGNTLFQPLPGPATGATAPGAFVEQVAWTSDSSAAPSSSSDVIVLTTSTGATRSESRPPVVGRGDTTNTAVWNDDQGHTFRLYSNRVPADVFDTVVSTVSVDPDGRARVAVPVGYREVARLSGGSVNATRPVLPTLLLTIGLVELAGPGYAIGFSQESDQSRATMTVMSVPRSAVWFVRNIENVQTVAIRGRAGWETDLADRGALIFWWEDDQTLVEVVTPSHAQSRELAESIRQVDDATWDKFIAAAQPLPASENSSDQTTFSSAGSVITEASPTTVP